MVKGFYFCCEFFFTAVKVWVTLKLAGAIWEPRQKRWMEYALRNIMMLIIAGLNMVNGVMSNVLFSNSALIIHTLLLSFVVGILYYCRYRDAFSMILLFWGMQALVDLFLQNLVYVILDIGNLQSDVLQNATITRAFYQLMWMAILLLGMKPVCRWGQHRRREVEKYRNKAWVLLLLLLICLVYFQRIYVPGFSEGLMYRWCLFLLGSLLLGSTILAYMAMQKERGNAMVLQQNMEVLQEEYRTAERHVKEMEIQRHDYRKHIQAIRELVIETGGAQEVLAYLEETDRQLQKSRYRNLVNHSLLNMVLNAKCREAEVSGISVQCETGDMSGLQLTQTEIVVLFFNVLDNAIEANQALNEGEERWIKLSCLRRGKMMVLSVANARVGQKLNFTGKIPKTTKADKKRHGFGMESIRLIVEQYEGHMQIEEHDRSFTLTLYLKGFG